MAKDKRALAIAGRIGRGWSKEDAESIPIRKRTERGRKPYRERRLFKHGHARAGGKLTRTYVSWVSMKRRCYNPNHVTFKDYGGRGITVCDRWLGKEGFKNFLSYMGERPSNMSLERVKNHLGYSPSNCIWATAKTQANNRRKRSNGPE